MHRLKQRIAETKPELISFFILISLVAFAAGFSDSIFSNYFKDAFDTTATQRAFLEFPRELPGMLCVIIIGCFSFLGDVRLALVAQVFGFVGLTVLGVLNPSYSVMMIFLFTSSLGMHLFMPLSDSIGMSLAEEGQVGRRVGQYGSVKTAVGCVAGILVFVGFRTEVLSFTTEIKWPFVIGAGAYFIAGIMALRLLRQTKGQKLYSGRKKRLFLFRREYKYYYILTILQGVQKQIAYVFGSWVIIDLLLKGADVMSLLVIAVSFLGVFFFRFVGRWIDQKGIRFMMYLDAVSFIAVYLVYGTVVWFIVESTTEVSPWLVMIVYLLFILDRLSMQIGVIKAVYLRSIALDPEEVTTALSTGISLDHLVAIIAAQISGVIWTVFGPQWVFYMAALISVGNLIVARKIKDPQKAAV